MNSITKRYLDNEKIIEIVRNCFGSKADIKEISELTDGYFNMSYAIHVDDIKTVLKIAPVESVKVLSYEHDLMNAEIESLKMMYDHHMLVPKIMFIDDSKRILDSSYFFMSFFEGEPFNKAKKTLSSIELKSVYQELSNELEKLHSIRGKYFGFIHDNRRRFVSWSDCFLSMITDLFYDANRINYEIPISLVEFIEVFNLYKYSLDEVAIPKLVHKDLWDGNIFIHEGKLEGIIDCERSLYGDPLLDYVCGQLHTNDDFIKSNKLNKFSETEQMRIDLYELYLYLLMYIEIPYREYETDFALWIKNQLNQVIRKLRSDLSK